jgi:hypothetical protein
VAPLRERPTSDLIVLGLAAVVAFVIIFATLGVIVATSTGHSPDVAQLAKAVSDLTGALIALIVGYLAGRGVNGNGNGNNPKPPA